MILDFVILRNGLPIFTMNFDPKKGVSHDQQKFTLISGFFSAIDTFIESVETLGEVSEIQMSSNTYFAFKKIEIPDGLLMFIITTDDETPKYYRKKIIEETSKKFIAEFDSTLDDSWRGNIDVFQKFNNMLLKILRDFYRKQKNNAQESIVRTREYFDENIPKNINSMNTSFIHNDNYNPVNASTQSANEYENYPHGVNANVNLQPHSNIYANGYNERTQFISSPQPIRINSPYNQNYLFEQNYPQQDTENRYGPTSYDRFNARVQRYNMLKELKSHYKELKPFHSVERSKYPMGPLTEFNESEDQLQDFQAFNYNPNVQYDQSKSVKNNLQLQEPVMKSYSQDDQYPNEQIYHENQITNGYQRIQQSPQRNLQHLENRNLAQFRNIRGTVYDVIPRRLSIRPIDLKLNVSNELERTVLFLIDGNRSLKEISETLNINNMYILTVCKELHRKGLIEIHR